MTTLSSATATPTSSAGSPRSSRLPRTQPCHQFLQPSASAHKGNDTDSLIKVLATTDLAPGQHGLTTSGPDRSNRVAWGAAWCPFPGHLAMTTSKDRLGVTQAPCYVKCGQGLASSHAARWLPVICPKPRLATPHAAQGDLRPTAPLSCDDIG